MMRHGGRRLGSPRAGAAPEGAPGREHGRRSVFRSVRRKDRMRAYTKRESEAMRRIASELRYRRARRCARRAINSATGHGALRWTREDLYERVSAR